MHTMKAESSKRWLQTSLSLFVFLLMSTRLEADVSALPFSFERNQGQAEPQVEYLARYGQVRLFMTREQVVFKLPGGTAPVRMRFNGSNPASDIIGEELLNARTHYIVGNASAAWNRQIPHYAKVRYRDLYPGIDLVFYHRDGQLEYDFIVSHGVDPDQIEMVFTGIDETILNDDDQVVLSRGAGSIVQSVPAAYQQIEGKRHAVDARQVLSDAGEIRFALSGYQSEHTLVVDPVLVFSRFFGGSGEEEVIGITTDREGNIFITGGSSSPNLPVTEDSLAYPASMFEVEGNRLAFVAKLDPTGTRLIYMTYLGGSKTSTSHFVRVDSEGNTYVAGRTEASDFPMLNPVQARYAGGSDDVFISKLNRDGSALIYSTYIGGSEYDQARSLALDSNGSVYVTGRTDSTDYPVVNPIIPAYAGEQDGFVTKLSPDGSSIVYSTYLGGSGNDIGHAITVDANGSAYVTGLSNSLDFLTVGAYQSAFRGGDGDDAIVVKLNAAGSAFDYSTFIGGTGDDESRSIAVDASGNAIISGYTRSRDFPSANAIQTRFGGGTHDIFVTSLNAKGSGLNFSTYIGGSGNDYGRGLALDQAGNIYLTGYTSSATDFPIHQPLQEKFGGGEADAFIMKLDPIARQILYSSFHGGSAHERGRAITVDATGNILMSGHSESTDFPVTTPPSPRSGGGADEAFIIKVAPE